MFSPTSACRLLLLFAWLAGWVQLGMGQPVFHKISTAQGLSQSSVASILQDKQGFLWFGTADGLNRYDGYGFTVFQHQQKDTTSLPANYISALAEDTNGRLWVGTATGGVCYLDRQTGRFVRVPLWAGRQRITIVSSIVAQGPDVWVGSDAAGLFHIDTRTDAVRWIYWDGGPVREPNVTALAAGSENTCWAGTGAGLIYQLAQKPLRAVHRLQIPAASGDVRINRLFEDSRGRLWVAAGASGIYRLEPGETQFQRVWYVSGQAGGVNAPSAFCEDGQKNIWVGTDDGILIAPGGDFRHAQHYRSDPNSESGLSSHAIKSLLEDRSGNLWIGTWEAGLHIVYNQETGFKTLTFKANQPNGLLSPKVTAIGGDQQGGIWLGSNVGLTYWQPANNRFTHFSPPRIAGPDINAIYNHPADRPLVAIWNQSVYGWNPAKRQFQKQWVSGDTSPVNSIVAFARTREGWVWLASQHTPIARLDPLTGRSELIPQSATGEADVRIIHPNALCETADGTLWMGMFNNGLYAYDLKSRRLRHFLSGEEPGRLSDNHILTLFEDSRRQLWIGTSGGGLNLYHPRTGTFSVYTTGNGLPSNTVKSILEDKSGNLWIATNNGLSKLDTGRRRFTSYTIHDGLPDREFLTNAGYRSPDGHMYFGSMGGLVYFHPDSIRTDHEALQVHLTSLRLFNRPVTAGGQDSPLQRPLSETGVLTLRHDQSVFTLDFLALHFRSAPNVQYAYRLLHFDKDWNYVGTQRSATYTNSDPGEYIFQVKATHRAGVWNGPVTSLTIRILPPWYRTWWAYGLYSLALLSALGAWRRIIRIREQFRADLRLKTLEAEKIREVDRLKTGFFTNISHEFRTPLTLIISPLAQFLADQGPAEPGEIRQQYGLMYRNAQRLLRLVNQLLDLSKLEAGHLKPQVSCNTLPDFVARLVAAFGLTARQHQIALTFESDFPDEPVWYDPDLLEKILSNLVANAIKFTPGNGAVTVMLDLAGPALVRITVRDSGVGISPEHLSHIFDRFYQVDNQAKPKTPGTGIGLALTRELIELIGGTITVVSQPGQGSTFTVTWPVGEPPPAADRQPVAPLSEVTLPANPADTLNIQDSSAPARPETILIVEDNDELRAYLCRLFVHSCHIVEAADGEEGWQKAQTLNPDLIISDLMMPGTDGVELCRRVKTHTQTSHIPFVLLTARQNAASQLDGYQVGADDYVGKPFHAPLLLSRVHNLLRTRQQLRERFGRVVTVQPSELTTTSADEVFLTNALRVVEEQLDNPDFGLKDLEEALNVSENLLYRKLKTLTGLSGNEFIRSIRLKRAAQWLQSESGLTISEIAYRVGFRDPAYFTRCFTKEFGLSPRQFAAVAGKVTDPHA